MSRLGALDALIDVNGSLRHNREMNFFVIGAIILGGLWGVPWIQASQTAALALFTNADLQTIMGFIFAIGIVVTVGCDGIWIMSEVIKIKTNHKHIQHKKMRVVAVLLCAALSCVPPVYAAVIYSSGLHKLLACIVLVVNFSYGIYGYAKLIDLLFDLKFKFFKTVLNASSQDLNHVQILLHQGVNLQVPEKINTYQQFFNYVKKNNLNHLRKESFFRKAYKYSVSILIAVSLASVDIYLTKDFLTSAFIANSVLALWIALMAAIPGTVATFISTWFVAEKTLQLMFKENEPQLVKQLFPKLGSIIAFMLVFVALLAPSAAAYITFTTLGKAGINAFLLYTALGSIIIARFTFSYFTLTRVTTAALIKILKYHRNYYFIYHNDRVLKNILVMLS